VCINSTDRCDAADSCECPWCDDQWNCPSFEGCLENGGFLCSNSYLPGTNQLWACIPAEWKCDGVWDCPSGEDEGSEYCNVGKCAGNHNLTYWYQCSDTGRCISISSVGNGEIDCVDGEDENPTIIEEIRSERTTETIPITGTTINPDQQFEDGTPTPTTLNTAAPTTSPTFASNMPTSSPTRSNNYPYGIDLVIQVSGVYLADVCSGLDARFKELETAVILVLNLKGVQVFSSCQRNNNHHNRLLQSLLDIESESDDQDSGEEDIYSRHDHTVIVKLHFPDRQYYLRLLKEILNTGHHLTQQDQKEAHKSVAKLSDEIQSELSNLLGILVEVKITRVSGTF